MRTLFIMLFMLVTLEAFALDRYPFTNVPQQKRFQTLTQQFRCLVCQNEDLASSNAPLATDLRARIYEMIKQGKTNREIRQYMVQRYGTFVLLKPPLMISTWMLWFAPFILLVFGFFILAKVIKKHAD